MWADARTCFTHIGRCGGRSNADLLERALQGLTCWLYRRQPVRPPRLELRWLQAALPLGVQRAKPGGAAGSQVLLNSPPGAPLAALLGEALGVLPAVEADVGLGDWPGTPVCAQTFALSEGVCGAASDI